MHISYDTLHTNASLPQTFHQYLNMHATFNFKRVFNMFTTVTPHPNTSAASRGTSAGCPFYRDWRASRPGGASVRSCSPVSSARRPSSAAVRAARTHTSRAPPLADWAAGAGSARLPPPPACQAPPLGADWLQRRPPTRATRLKKCPEGHTPLARRRGGTGGEGRPGHWPGTGEGPAARKVPERDAGREPMHSRCS